MFSIQEQCSQFKNNVLNSRTMFLDSFLCVEASSDLACRFFSVFCKSVMEICSNYQNIPKIVQVGPFI